jgi:hypothetical protein
LVPYIDVFGSGSYFVAVTMESGKAGRLVTIGAVLVRAGVLRLRSERAPE